MISRLCVALSSTAITCSVLSAPLMANEDIVLDGVKAQQVQAALQTQIDAADEQTRATLEELRQLERETRLLTRENSALSARLTTQATRQQRMSNALDTLEETRAALPQIEADMTRQLTQWIKRDLPFLQNERMARVVLIDSEGLESVERISELLGVWRQEFAYGREVDTWRGRLAAKSGEREVDFLRIGRIGFYYLSPDGQEGGVWLAEASRWQSLDESARRDVRHGLRMANDQRAPALLTLPLSVTVADQSTSASASESEAGGEQ
ncbi:DUF3450 domain-containing protein [Vreelandella vilamensis]|uniref:DUF3450 domain-containing protein n=1 Tax=Vreelandella vilamensis TaxID=531309 RepID=UPI00286AC503|nr:DUF3450 domain-containing protein [Halomonas vilamensis]